jgi:hypothetical protein
MMQFEQFIRDIDTEVKKIIAAAKLDGGSETATWTAGTRKSELAPLAPRNVSLALVETGKPPVMTWYPIDAALIPVVAQRIAGFLQEA